MKTNLLPLSRPLPERGKSVTADPLRISVIIANFNYERYVARAIESALQLDWPAVEVIVVDDGSTDNSIVEIERFADRVTVIQQENAGQRAANNAGFAASTGDLIVFLDADDVLEPAFGRAVAMAWRPGVSKIQVQMRRVDEDERPLGSLVPALEKAPTPQAIRRWTLDTTEYPTPPGSGNAYSRSFLRLFFPIGPEHDAFTDSTCLALAPLLGDVVTVLEPLVRYRMHGTNDSNLLVAPGRFGREVGRAVLRQQSARTICERLGAPSPAVENVRRSRHLLQLRIASLRMQPEQHPLPGDSRSAALFDIICSIVRAGADPFMKRLAVAAWAVATLMVPRRLVPALIEQRFKVR